MTTAAQAPRPVLLFDGDCGFCTTSAGWIGRWSPALDVVPYQRADLEAYGLTAEACDLEVHYVHADNRIDTAERAIAAALSGGNRFWRLVSTVMRLPGVVQVSGVVYRLVARSRHRLPGGTPACKL